MSRLGSASLAPRDLLQELFLRGALTRMRALAEPEQFALVACRQLVTRLGALFRRSREAAVPAANRQRDARCSRL
jgi:hypothetical protein